MDSSHPSTALLLHRIATADDRRAFEQFFTLYYPRLLKFAHFYVKSRELAEEVVSDVFFKLWQKRATLPEVKHMDSYLYISIKNQSLNYLQKAENQPAIPLEDLPAYLSVETLTPERTLLVSELQAEIHRAVDKLPPQCKIIFKLIREDGLKYKEVAEILGISTKTIEVQIGIAIKKISVDLQAHLTARQAPPRVLRIAQALIPLLLAGVAS
ncbi:RNA polymerase sigma-70 factor [Hymenobacter psychrotolerans]|uniref:RNA polymerase sigma-70 factor, ECF subfamily n=1 Tax=Hymenobacter psychrotolerans DSM 18569 TaxID=1121959 RepID=A0A1M7EQ38_9BACT|nr:RNA polymerase sigma-70 factor [Hymenobacter psychrotolerans]SHL93834.1 RNA polymerase sigma-70 factor, ECF subfamily [Hymenobacter psychrotolerans DSM 18569]